SVAVGGPWRRVPQRGRWPEFNRFSAQLAPLWAPVPNRTALDRVGDAAAGLGDVDAAGRERVDGVPERREVLGVQLAGMDPENAAVAGREDRERQGKNVDAERSRGRPCLVLAYQDRVVELHVAGELGHKLRLVDGDADDLQVGPRRLQLFEHGNFAQARPTPRSPEVDQQGLTG